jgi:hypothetical protein
MTEEIETDPVTEGFREPPGLITAPCSAYIKRVVELRDFTQFVFNFVKTSADLRRLLPLKGQESAGPNEFSIIRYDFSRHHAFVNEIMLSRAVESFNLYWC